MRVIGAIMPFLSGKDFYEYFSISAIKFQSFYKNVHSSETISSWVIIMNEILIYDIVRPTESRRNNKNSPIFQGKLLIFHLVVKIYVLINF